LQGFSDAESVVDGGFQHSAAPDISLVGVGKKLAAPVTHQDQG
jgi:hypothetical protein